MAIHKVASDKHNHPDAKIIANLEELASEGLTINAIAPYVVAQGYNRTHLHDLIALHPEYSDSIEKGLAIFERENIASIRKSGETNWQAKAWVTERRLPQWRMPKDDPKIIINNGSQEDDLIPFVISTLENAMLPTTLEMYKSGAAHNGAKGGRGGAKSSEIGLIMLRETFDSTLKDTNFMCLREFQTSIKASVYSVLAELIRKHNLSKFFDIKHDVIINQHYNITFYFKGCQDPEGIKSVHNITRSWSEEAQTGRLAKLDIIMPSIRNDRNIPTRTYYTFNPTKPIDDVVAYINRYESVHWLHINMMRNPKDPSQAYLPKHYQNSTLMQLYEGDLKYQPEIVPHKWYGEASTDYAGMPFINVSVRPLEGEPTTNGHVYAFIDPSFKGGDYTALTVVWLEGELMMVYGQIFKRAWNECLDECVRVLSRFKVQNFAYEDNSLGTAPLDAYNPLGWHAIPINNTANKINRIYKYGYLAKDMIMLHDNNSHTYIEQVRNYDKTVSKASSGQHDDAPDSLTSCIEFAGIR